MIDDLEIKVNLGFFRFTRAIRPLSRTFSFWGLGTK